MLTIRNLRNNTQSDYSRHDLAREARFIARHAPDSDGKCRAWSVEVITGGDVRLRCDYLTPCGTPRIYYYVL